MPLERLLRPKAVFIDVGGPIYTDDNFLHAATEAIARLRAERGLPAVAAEEVRAVYDRARNAQTPSLRRELAAAFLGGAEAREEFWALARTLWHHPPGSAYDDAAEFLRRVSQHAAVGVLANQEATVITSLERDGLGEFVDVWGVSAVVGWEKPSRELFDWCLRTAGVDASEAIHIGNRFDNDVLPANRLGLGTVWVLRGESPDEAPPEQAAVADLVVPDLRGLADVLFP